MIKKLIKLTSHFIKIIISLIKMCHSLVVRTISAVSIIFFITACVIVVVYSSLHLKDGCPILNNCTFDVYNCQIDGNCSVSMIINGTVQCAYVCSNRSIYSCPLNGSVCYSSYNIPSSCHLENCYNNMYYIAILVSSVAGGTILLFLIAFLSLLAIQYFCTIKKYYHEITA
jgi:hypothetical protein